MSRTIDSGKKSKKHAKVERPAVKGKDSLLPLLPKGWRRHSPSDSRSYLKNFSNGRVLDFIESMMEEKQKKVDEGIDGKVKDLLERVSQEAKKMAKEHCAKMKSQLIKATAERLMDVEYATKHRKECSEYEDYLDVLWNLYDSNDGSEDCKYLRRVCGTLESKDNLRQWISGYTDQLCVLAPYPRGREDPVLVIRDLARAAVSGVGMSIDYCQSCEDNPAAYLGLDSMPELREYCDRRIAERLSTRTADMKTLLF
ncbi:MAG: hypothetical protein JSS82_12595 [Bacteroidetes bacterium]|nr:hypothetical protein [Bacteroidota bacterium]